MDIRMSIKYITVGQNLSYPPYKHMSFPYIGTSKNVHASPKLIYTLPKMRQHTPTVIKASSSSKYLFKVQFFLSCYTVTANSSVKESFLLSAQG